MLKNIIKVLMSNFILTIVGLVNSFAFPIIMSIEGYAHYQEFTLYVSYINICHLGIASGMFINYGGKDYQDTNKSRYKSEIYLILSVLAFFSCIGLAITLFTGSEMLLAVTLAIIPICINASFKALYQAWNRFTEYAVTNAFPNVAITIITILIFGISGKVDSSWVIIIYLIINYVICFYFLKEFTTFVKGNKSDKLFSRDNIETTKNGFLITAGNYISTLFHSIDKQFVNLIYSVHSFAMYSFAMSTQSIMTIFITALAQPFYPRLARNDLKKDEYKILKELLIMFGAFSGCAYFAISFLVEHFITKYTDSLKVIGMFFAVFPAMAVINVLYVNLYKIKRKLKKYVMVLVGMLFVAAVLNSISVLLKGDYVGISIATMLVYYIWLYYSQTDFEEVTITIKDTVYLIGFLSLYFFITNLCTPIIGFMIYTVGTVIWDYIIYRTSIKYLFKILLIKYNKKR